MKKKKVLVIGQTPPPYHGQAMMINRLVNFNFEKIEIYHIRMSFSDDMEEVGRFKLQKILHLFYIIVQAIKHKFKYDIKILYYPPAGPNFVPIARDLILLICIRFFFKKIIFHFRAAGISDYLARHPVLRKIASIAYGNPDIGIQLSELNPPDAAFFSAKQKVIIPNGLEDAASPYLPIVHNKNGNIKILYVGSLVRSKGILDLLSAAEILFNKKYPVTFDFVGAFSSKEFQFEVLKFCEKKGLTNIVNFVGVKSGGEKWEYFVKADIFCFPSFYESESFGNVLIEAMMFSLPIVATRWRGIPDIVQEEDNGLLVAPNSPSQIVEKLQFLIKNPQIRIKMGERGRNLYIDRYTIEKHKEKMEEAFLSIA